MTATERNEQTEDMCRTCGHHADVPMLLDMYHQPVCDACAWDHHLEVLPGQVVKWDGALWEFVRFGCPTGDRRHLKAGRDDRPGTAYRLKPKTLQRRYGASPACTECIDTYDMRVTGQMAVPT